MSDFEAPDGSPGEPEPKVRQGVVVRRSVEDRAAIRRRQLGLQSASLWILAVAFLYAMVGLLQCAVTRDAVQRELADLSHRPDNATVYTKPLGVETTVADARAGLVVLETMTWIINMGLVALLIGLWLWSRVNPVPALTVALVFFMGLTLLELVLSNFEISVLSAVLKLACLLGLTLGLKTAMEQRAARRAIEAEGV